MIIEIQEPGLERRTQEIIASGRFRDAGDLIAKALDALSVSSGAIDCPACPPVESVPDKLGGAWVFRNTRMPVAAVSENLEDGLTIEKLEELYHGLTREQVRAALEFAAHTLRPLTYAAVSNQPRSDRFPLIADR
jgi:uncharacterized protein (DUF433 family)